MVCNMNTMNSFLRQARRLGPRRLPPQRISTAQLQERSRWLLASSAAGCSFSTHHTAVQRTTSSHTPTIEQLLEQALVDRKLTQALALFGRLEAPPSQLLAQKLAVLLAKRGNLQQTERAIDILRSVYRRPTVQPDDYIVLASIYVVDACLRHKLLDQAIEIHEEAMNIGVPLDLAAYGALVEALVVANRLEDATALLHDVAVELDISLPEHAYFALLEVLVERKEYSDATTLLKSARARGVGFTNETFQPLVEMTSTDEDDADGSIVAFLSYIENVWDEVKRLDSMADYIEDVDDHEEHDDDDDDDDGSGRDLK